MSDPSGPADPSRPPAPRLDRAPGERYRGGQPPRPRRPADAGRGRRAARTAGRSPPRVVVAIARRAPVRAPQPGRPRVRDARHRDVRGWAVALALVWNARRPFRAGARSSARSSPGAIVGRAAPRVGVGPPRGWRAGAVRVRERAVRDPRLSRGARRGRRRAGSEPLTGVDQSAASISAWIERGVWGSDSSRPNRAGRSALAGRGGATARSSCSPSK